VKSATNTINRKKLRTLIKRMPLDLLEFLTSLKLFFHFVEALLIPLVGPDGYVDPSRFFVILVDALGNGVSSSPSNSSVQPRMGFPVFTIRDMVNSQHRLLTENLGINHIRAVMGISMGGMQTFQWIVSYPEFMDKAVALVGSPRLTAYDLLLWRSEQSAIEEDKDWNGGNYTTEPRLDTVAEIHNLALTTPSYRVRETAADKFPGFLDEVDKDGLGRMDANDWLRQLQAMMTHNIASPSAIPSKMQLNKSRPS
jgi:homoserine O-acetyltransferase/O-succinyltransferase